MGYIVGHPIKRPQDFYGRAAQVQRYFEIVAGSQVQSASILGLRRSGKTSFLQYVAHPEVMRHHIPDAERYVTLYLDISTCKDPADFYLRLLKRLQRSVAVAMPARTWDSSANHPQQPDVYDLEAAFARFPEKRFVLLMDEFDRLTSGGFGHSFLSELRYLTSVWDYELACVTSSYWDLYQLGAHVGLSSSSPFYNIFFPQPIRLRGLAEEETQMLIRKPAKEAGVPFTPEEIAEIRRLAGTLPFFVQATAAHQLQAKDRGCILTGREFLRQMVLMTSSYFSQWWQQFSDLEREMLRSMAHDQPLGQLPYSGAEISQLTDRFINLGLIEEQDDEYQPNGLIFRTWLVENAGRRKIPTINHVTRRQRANGTHPAEPHLDQELYEQILQTIQDVGKQFERVPATYKGKNEEDLRDHLLLILEPRFDGTATGETFNRSGKTDILIRNRGSNVFIAECKFWKGTRVYIETINQLLGYLTWRDSKAAIILFVRNKDFSAVIKTVEQVTPNHPNYLDYLGRWDESWLNYRFHLTDDPSRVLQLAVLLFHVPQ